MATQSSSTSAKQSKSTKSPEAKAKAFKDLATVRVNKALKAMRQLKHLSNKNAYAYSTEQVKTITTALTKATEEVTAAFNDPSAAKSEGFTL